MFSMIHVEKKSTIFEWKATILSPREEEGRRAETFSEHDQVMGDSVIGENAKHKAAFSAVETHEANNKLDVRIAQL